MQEKNEPDAIIVREKWALAVRENEIERMMKEMINLCTQLQSNLFFNGEIFPKRKIKYQKNKFKCFWRFSVITN
jgi:hypothetical protein